MHTPVGTMQSILKTRRKLKSTEYVGFSARTLPCFYLGVQFLLVPTTAVMVDELWISPSASAPVGNQHCDRRPTGGYVGTDFKGLLWQLRARAPSAPLSQATASASSRPSTPLES